MRLTLSSLAVATLVACATPPEEVAQPVRAVTTAAPAYPAYARRYGIHGAVRLRILVLADGRVAKIQVQDSSGSPHLDAAAVDAVRRSDYQPAQTRSGKIVDSWTTASYRFVLDK